MVAFALDNWNDAAQVTIMSNAMQRLARESGAAIMGIAHHGKDISRGVAGSFAQKANVDFILKALMTVDDALSGDVRYRHGLRAAELVTLKWDQIDFARGNLHVNRVKNGSPSVHQLSGVELRALRRLKRESPQSAFAFVSERGVPFSTAGFRKMVARLGAAVGFK